MHVFCSRSLVRDAYLFLGMFYSKVRKNFYLILKLTLNSELRCTFFVFMIYYASLHINLFFLKVNPGC